METLLVNELKEISLSKFLDGFKKRGENTQVRVMLVSRNKAEAVKNFNTATRSFDSSNSKILMDRREIHYKGRHTIKFMCAGTADRDLHAPLRAKKYTHKLKLS